MKTKKNRKTNHLTISERKAQKRAEQDLQRFKKKLHFMVGKTKVVWNGKPYSSKSTYDFQIHPTMIQFFMGLFSQNMSSQADEATLEAAQAVADLNKEDFTDPNQEGNIEEEEGKENG